MDQYVEGFSYDQAVDALHQRWDERNFHHWCHTISNAEVVCIALLWGESDFTKTIARAVMAGFDTDCNGATVGSLWGMMHGVRGIPPVWTKPIEDQFQTTVAGYHNYSISRMADEMVELAIKYKP